jgi:hypothetical protein
MTRILVVLMVSFVAASCALVRSSVTVSHVLPQSGAGKTVVIMPYTPGLSDGPDYQSYRGKLAAHLEARGYDVVPASDAQAADYIAFFNYGVDGETPVNLLESAPAPRTGSIITYGIRSPFSQATHSVYARTVILEILDRARFRPNDPASYVEARVYSGWVKSEGACSTMAPVIDPMLTALFEAFPGQSGGVRMIDLPADSSCGPDRFASRPHPPARG